MDAKTLDLARKLHTQMASDKEDGEVARRKLNDLLARHSLRMSDVPSLLAQGPSEPARSVEEDFIRAAAALQEKQEQEEAARQARRAVRMAEIERVAQERAARQQAAEDAHEARIKQRIRIQEEAVAAGPRRCLASAAS